jgi:hypothetical protein
MPSSDRTRRRRPRARSRPRRSWTAPRSPTGSSPRDTSLSPSRSLNVLGPRRCSSSLRLGSDNALPPGTWISSQVRSTPVTDPQTAAAGQNPAPITVPLVHLGHHRRGTTPRHSRAHGHRRVRVTHRQRARSRGKVSCTQRSPRARPRTARLIQEHCDERERGPPTSSGRGRSRRRDHTRLRQQCGSR